MMQVWGPCHDHGNMNDHSNGIQKVLFERNFESKIYNFTYWIRGGQSMERDVRLLDVSGPREQSETAQHCQHCQAQLKYKSCAGL